MEVGGQRHVPANLPPGKTRYPLYRRMGGPQGRSGLVRKISPPTGIRSPDRPARSESLYQLSLSLSASDSTGTLLSQNSPRYMLSLWDVFHTILR
jgi:hypothetical protein